MASPDTLQFTRRYNADGTIDSICRQCFNTIATREHEADLSSAEQNHVCDPWTVQRFQQGQG